MSQQSHTDQRVPEVLIIGAGVGGLMLAILLEQIGIPYHIFERAQEVKPLGSAMGFMGNIFPALEQIGIYEELKQVAKPYFGVDFYDADLKKLGCFNVEDSKVATGYHSMLFSRPRLYEILFRRVPAQRISFKKRVLRTEEKEGKVYIHCSDNTTYTGDILVGADGAYSAVRQSMYKRMDEKGILPKSDLEGFSIGYTTIVGVATPRNPEKYPTLKEETSAFNQILYEDGANCYVVALPDNQISWGFGQQIPESVLKEKHFRNSEWGPEAGDATLMQYRNYPCPVGGTMGELFDATPQHLISKVFIEEKLFKTWHYGRAVLLGDGARSALHDAIVLANCLYSMTDSSLNSINVAFKDYYRQRYPQSEIAFNDSVAMSKILHGQKWWERLIRHIVLNYIPRWMLKAQIWKGLAYRQQIAWLPLIENRGKGPMLPQEFGKGLATNTVSV
ncbi:hypothetical protein BGZ79_004025 [Entomortierella chlamydospora]|nr:hypothetical protein BGZ79_004025 [Entomortierella chlamydospora]